MNGNEEATELIQNSSSPIVLRPIDKSDLSTLEDGSGETGPGNCSTLQTTGSILEQAASIERQTKYKSSSVTTVPVSTTTSSSKHHSVVATITQGGGHSQGEIGLAFMELVGSRVTMMQFVDSVSYSKLQIKLLAVKPTAIVLPDTAVERCGSLAALFQLIGEWLPQSDVSTLHRKYFNDKNGLELLEKLMEPNSSRLVKDIRLKPYALSAVFALMKLTEFTLNICVIPKSVQFVYETVGGTCSIDPETVHNLELLSCSTEVRDFRSSLFGVLNQTVTGHGARLLRANILQPPTDISTILTRQDAVEELMMRDDTYLDLRELLKALVDVTQLISLCVHVTREETGRLIEFKLGQVIALKHTLDRLPRLIETLAQYKSDLFKSMFKNLDSAKADLLKIRENIDAVISEEVHCEKSSFKMRWQKAFSIKPNIQGVLDIQRQTFGELNDDANLCYRDMCEKHDLPLKLGFTLARGYYFHIHARQGLLQNKLAPQFIGVTRHNNSISFTTRIMQKINDRITDVYGEILVLSNCVITHLLSNIRSHINCLYNVTETIAIADMVLSFAFVGRNGKFVKPEVTDDVLNIKNGRHPILWKFSQTKNDQSVTPNDTYALTDERRFFVVTGPNMAGKTTYIKQVALIQIIAQIGSFVPADYCAFKIVDNIFSRMGHNDDAPANNSAFVKEVKDVKYIMNNVTDSSLIIIDELGRSTAHDEGFAICWAVSEALLKSKAFVFVATHYWDLANLDSYFPIVENMHFEPQVNEYGAVELDHKLHQSRYTGPAYGFELVDAAGFPEGITLYARQLAAELLASNLKSNPFYSTEILKNRAKYRLSVRIAQLRKHVRQNSDLTEEVCESLVKLKDDYFAELNRLDDIAALLDSSD